MAQVNVTPKTVFTSPINFIAFGFGAGLSPWLPGTCGTLVAIPLYLLLAYLPWQLYLAVVLLSFIVGIWICDKAEKAVGIPDYRGIVWDEIVGFWVTMFMIPPSWLLIAFGFVLFRFFDIIKPWPINWLNTNLHGGFGIMVDDLLAAIISCGLLHMVLIVAKAS